MKTHFPSRPRVGDGEEKGALRDIRARGENTKRKRKQSTEPKTFPDSERGQTASAALKSPAREKTKKRGKPSEKQNRQQKKKKLRYILG